VRDECIESVHFAEHQTLLSPGRSGGANANEERAQARTSPRSLNC
jgi:hypothetical protein